MVKTSPNNEEKGKDMNVLSAGKNLLDLVMFEKNGKFEKINEAEARQLLSEGFSPPWA